MEIYNKNDHYDVLLRNIYFIEELPKISHHPFHKKKPIPVKADSMVGNTFTLQTSHFNIEQPTLAVQIMSCLLGCFKQLRFTKRFIVLNEFLTHKAA